MDKTLKILFLEDRVEDLILIQREIRKEFNFDPLNSSDRGSYKHLLQTTTPDIILSDYTLPELDGIEAIELAKKYHPDVPIIIVTGSLNEETAVKCMKHGAWDYVLKSRLLQLNQAILRTLNSKEEKQKRKDAELRLKENQQQLNNLISNLAGIVYRCDNNRKWTMEFLSGACEKITGYKPEDILHDNKLSYSELIHQDDRDRIWDIIEDSINNKQHFMIEYRIIRKDGSIGWVWEQGLGIRDESDRLIALEGFITDITLRKRAETGLKESEKKYKEQSILLDGIFNNIPDILGIQGKDHNVIRYNKAGYDFLNIDKDKVMGRKCHELIGLKDICPDCATQECYETKKPAQVEKYLPESGRWFDARSYPILDENGNIKQVVEHLRDITEKKRREDQIRTDLEEKKTLLQELYHRTKNNMQVISSILSLKANKTDNLELKEAFKDINNKIKSMALVHQKLYQSKDLSRVDLSNYVNDLVNVLIVSNDVEPGSIKMQMKLEEVKVLIDSAIPLGLILSEIISNIFKHAFNEMSKGTITINLLKAENDHIIIDISDNGKGIPDDMILENSTSMGMQTIFTLINHQLKGLVNYKNDNGLHWHIDFADNLHKVRV